MNLVARLETNTTLTKLQCFYRLGAILHRNGWRETINEIMKTPKLN